MIGNDIVDLAQAAQDSNWQRRGFLAKLFTDYEQDIIHAVTNPEQLVWLLWSLKESAYKAQFRETRQRVFAPQKISCQLNKLTETAAEATVTYGRVYQATSVINSCYVASVAWLPAVTQQPAHNVFPILDIHYKNQHQAVRQEAINCIFSHLAIKPDSVAIHKNRFGIPFLSAGSQQIPLSLSHHGQYGAFAIDKACFAHLPAFL